MPQPQPRSFPIPISIAWLEAKWQSVPKSERISKRIEEKAEFERIAKLDEEEELQSLSEVEQEEEGQYAVNTAVHRVVSMVMHTVSDAV